MALALMQTPAPLVVPVLSPVMPAVPAQELVGVHQLGLAVPQAVRPDAGIVQQLRAGIEKVPAQNGNIPRRGEMALGVQPAGVPEGGVGHPQLRRPGVHLFHKHRLAAAHQLGHCHSGIVG